MTLRLFLLLMVLLWFALLVPALLLVLLSV